MSAEVVFEYSLAIWLGGMALAGVAAVIAYAWSRFDVLDKTDGLFLFLPIWPIALPFILLYVGVRALRRWKDAHPLPKPVVVDPYLSAAQREVEALITSGDRPHG